uniref:Uncharacterized protein n=1 Tax=Tetradesmus obliquus TaxID=3088 RepID=A0A383V4W9_TETOB|eukprot:jgi/Sobl393_1/14486/SZX60655.1
MMLHRHHSEQQQEQQQQQQQNSQQQLRADLLPIPAFHQQEDVLQLLPGGQAYLVARFFDNASDDAASEVIARAHKYAGAMETTLEHCCMQEQGSLPMAVDGSSPVLSAAAVRLMLELQLLAAGAVQRLQQQQQPVDATSPHFQLLLACTAVLQKQLQVRVQTGASSLPPEVLQQAGLQLLQALAAPLQQLQLAANGASWRAVLVPAAAANDPASLSLNHALLALGAAAPGLTYEEVVAAAPGHGLNASPMFKLAAAQPETFTALLDCFKRSPVLQAADMLTAVEALAHAAGAVLSPAAAAAAAAAAEPPGLLSNTAAVAGLDSAVASFAKRAVQLTRAAVQMQGQSSAAAQDAAAVYFPAALIDITDVHKESVARSLFQASRNASAAGAASAGSSSSSSQAAASTALLSVFAARGLVQLADAGEAAGPQLLFRCIKCSRAQLAFKRRWVAAQGGTFLRLEAPQMSGPPEMHTAPGQWQVWQSHMLQAMLQLVLAFNGTDAVQSAATETAPAAAAATAAGPSTAAVAAARSVSGSGSCSRPGHPSSAQQVSWGYLLQLQQHSWAAALAAFDARWPSWRDDVQGGIAASAASTNELVQRTEQQYTDALELCRALEAAAPLRLLCNNSKREPGWRERGSRCQQALFNLQVQLLQR